MWPSRDGEVWLGESCSAAGPGLRQGDKDVPCGLGLPGTVRDADPAWGYWVVCEDGAWGSLGSPEAGAVLGAGREGSGGGLEPLGRDPGVSGPRADGRLVRVQLCARPCHAHASQAAPGAEHAQLLSGAGCGGGTLGRTARPGARPAAPPRRIPGPPAACGPRRGLVPVAAPVRGLLDAGAFAALPEADVPVHLVHSLVPATGKGKRVTPGAGAGAAQLPCLAGGPGQPGGKGLGFS